MSRTDDYLQGVRDGGMSTLAFALGLRGESLTVFGHRAKLAIEWLDGAPDEATLATLHGLATQAVERATAPAALVRPPLLR